MSKSIQIILNSARRAIKPECWAAAFRLILADGMVFQETPPFYPLDKGLTFKTKSEADRWADIAARQWCADNYPGWPAN
jgi:hypothetical protein